MEFSSNFVENVERAIKEYSCEGKHCNRFLGANLFLYELKQENKAAYVEKKKIFNALIRNLFPFETNVVKTFTYFLEDVHSSCEILNLAEVMIHIGEGKYEGFFINNTPQYYYKAKKHLQGKNLKVVETLPSIDGEFWKKEYKLKIRKDVQEFRQSVSPILKPVMSKEYLEIVQKEIKPLPEFKDKTLIECLLYIRMIVRYEDKFALV